MMPSTPPTTDRAVRAVYATDNSIYQIEPAAVAVPASHDDVVALVRANLDRATPLPIVARGGGTGTNGQSLTSGLSVDLKRGLNKVIAIDVAARTAVVQPGVVTGALNTELKPHGLYWAPHTSTVSRATVGGMISTDAAGKGSLVHGRANRHVHSVDLVLDDGSTFHAEPVTIDEATRRADGNDRPAQIWRALLDLTIGDELGLPELARGFSGYGIHRLRTINDAGQELIDPVALACGAEGTLGIITQATLTLTPIPDSVSMLVAVYPTFAAALDDAVALRESGPVAIECFDETTLDAGRASPAWPALGAVVGDRTGAVLAMEFESASARESARAAVDTSARALVTEQIDDPTAQAQVWKVRADAVGLLAKVVVEGPGTHARPTAFVEDCAVPVAEMPAFIAGFRKALDDAGLVYGMFGHADVGCVHVRPALDLRSPAHREKVSEITNKVRDLVATHGGILWGEHGRGFRGNDVTDVLPAETVATMRQVKAIFDPDDLFNPGKLYRPAGSDEPLLDVGDPTMRGGFDAEIPVTLRTEFDSAFACNGNGLCHHHSPSEVMCPSYKATLDPALSPKGRADLLRAWMRNPGADPDLEDAIADNLGQCLSCSACTGTCPVEVDIPELKSRFLEHRHTKKPRPAAHQLMRQFESLARVAAAAGPLAAIGAIPAGMALGLVDLPTPAKRTRVRHATFDRRQPTDLVIVPDVFTAILEPTILDHAVAVLESLGWSVSVADFVPSGKYEHVKGMRREFTRRADKQRALIASIANSGARPVAIEPAISLLYAHEYATILGEALPTVHPLSTVLAERAEQLTATDPSHVTVLGHCTERATSPKTAAQWQPILETVGHRVDLPELGCCGMAGVFGHEAENQHLSRRIWDLSWAPTLDNAADTTLTATGHSCRIQAERFGKSVLQHPVMLLKA